MPRSEDPEGSCCGFTFSGTGEKAIEQTGFDYIQIHGEIPSGYAESCCLPVLKAFNIRDMKDFSQYSADLPWPVMCLMPSSLAVARYLTGVW